MAFIESPRGKEECARLVKALEGKPAMINVLPDVSRYQHWREEMLIVKQGLTGNLTVSDCKELGFKMAMYPCTGFIPSMISMQRSYGMLKEKGSDLKACDGLTIKNFFEQVGLKACFDYDQDVEKVVKQDVPGGKYEKLNHHDLF